MSTQVTRKIKNIAQDLDNRCGMWRSARFSGIRHVMSYLVLLCVAAFLAFLSGCGAIGSEHNTILPSTANNTTPTPEDLLLVRPLWRKISPNQPTQELSCPSLPEFPASIQKMLKESGIATYQGNSPPTIAGYYAATGWVERSTGGRPYEHRIDTSLYWNHTNNLHLNFEELDIQGKGWLVGEDRHFTACIKTYNTEQPIIMIVSGTMALKKIYTNVLIWHSSSNAMELLYVIWDYRGKTKAEFEANAKRQQSQSKNNKQKNENEGYGDEYDPADNDYPTEPDPEPPGLPSPSPPWP